MSSDKVGGAQSSSIAAQILAASAAEPPKLASLMNMLAPAAKPLKIVLGITVDYVVPVYVGAFRYGVQLYKKLPIDLFSALLGLGLAFCGGAYCASIAAVEACRLSGWETTRQALLDIYEDCQSVYDAHVRDETRDDDGDGVADVKQLSAQDLMSRKLAVYAMAIKDPERFTAAIGGLYTAWLAVQGVLRLEFAKTITLGVSIAEMATPTLQRLGVPLLVHVVPKPYHHWIPIIIKTTARSIGVALAWRLQVIVSAVHLAMRGGLLFARSIMRWAHAHGYLSEYKEDQTYLDEALGYSVAAAGFYAQWSLGFGMPFPLNLFVLPLDAVEWYIRYSITSSAPVA